VNSNCFVIMPYGPKRDIDGKSIDFDKLYELMIKQAVSSVGGLICVRCDDIEQPGWIHERMLKHILEDRVAVVDTSTLNANVFYELGVRHALRRSTTVLIQRKGSEYRPELQHPSPDRLVGEVQPELGEQILDIAEAQGEAKIQPHRVSDDVRRELVASK
jgi:hypothetical protein